MFARLNESGVPEDHSVALSDRRDLFGREGTRFARTGADLAKVLLEPRGRPSCTPCERFRTGILHPMPCVPGSIENGPSSRSNLPISLSDNPRASVHENQLVLIAVQMDRDLGTRSDLRYKH